MNRSVRAKQNWGLAPRQHHLQRHTHQHVAREQEVFGSFPGERNFNRFPGWLGKNSTHGKNKRLLMELYLHCAAGPVQSRRRVVAGRVRAFAQVAHHETAQVRLRGREGKGRASRGDGAHGRVLAHAAGLGHGPGRLQVQRRRRRCSPTPAGFPPPSSPRSRASATRGRASCTRGSSCRRPRRTRRRRGGGRRRRRRGGGGGGGRARQAEAVREEARGRWASSRRTTKRRSRRARPRARSQRRRRSDTAAVAMRG